jgi:histidinol-phosphate aminotransferase
VKKFNLNQLLRTNIRNIEPYSTARDEYSGTALVNLDANENSFGSIGDTKHNRYPDPYQTELKILISEIKNIPVDRIFLGNGSDEAIDLIYRAFCIPGTDNVITCPPTYGMYKVSAQTQDIQCTEVSLTEDFDIDPKRILAAADTYTKCIWLCSPNNPSGNLLSYEKIEYILTNFSGIVIIDEAYIDFADSPSWTTRLDEFPNLIVLHTFSKAWGLANIRLGLMAASPEIISVINAIKLPYNINGIIQDFAYSHIKKHHTDKDIMVAKILKERAKLIREIKQIPYIEKIFPTEANFILVKMKQPRKVYNYLIEKGIIVRDRSNIQHCEKTLRITIGTSRENNLLISSLKKFK